MTEGHFFVTILLDLPREIMQSFNHFLREKGVSNEIRSLLYHIARAVKYINFSLRAGNTGTLGTQNIFGERDRKSTRLNSSHIPLSRMPSSA